MKRCKPIGSPVSPVDLYQEEIKTGVLSDEEHSENRIIAGTPTYPAIRIKPDLCVPRIMLGAKIDYRRISHMSAAERAIQYLTEKMSVKLTVDAIPDDWLYAEAS